MFVVYCNQWILAVCDLDQTLSESHLMIAYIKEGEACWRGVFKILFSAAHMEKNLNVVMKASTPL